MPESQELFSLSHPGEFRLSLFRISQGSGGGALWQDLKKFQRSPGALPGKII
jgi:hypothetical protein